MYGLKSVLLLHSAGSMLMQLNVSSPVPVSSASVTVNR
jgi:hypothetical protein